MKPGELRNKSDKELQKLLNDKREQLRKMRFGLFLDKVKNVSEINQVRKDIARILTILREKQMVKTS